MAFFKFRKGGDESPGARRPPESIEAMRKRARHRLIGASVLVLAGVIGFPLLFDTQPRPIAVDIPIEIPDRDKVKPLTPPAPRAAQAPQAPQAAGSVTAAAPSAATQPAAPAKPTAAPAVQAPAAPAEPKPEAAAPKSEPPPEPKTAAKDSGVDSEAAKAQALLEGKPVKATAAAGEGRYVVQIGAFADPAKARAARLKVERAGLKTYTHVAETKDGQRVRVRVGPFANRAEADKAASKIKGLDLPAAILTL